MLRPTACALAALVVLPLSILGAQVASVDITPAQAAVQAGGKQQFRAVARDARGAALHVPITWLATPFDIAAADSTGLVTTTRAGRTYVIAVAGGRPGMAVLDITERGLASLRVTAAGEAVTVVGGTVQLEIGGVTSLGDPVPRARCSGAVPRRRSRRWRTAWCAAGPRAPP